MNSFITLSPQQLRRAADIKERIDALQNDLIRVLGTSATPAALGTPSKKRTMSPAVRARIAAAARARWAKIKGRNRSATPAQPRRRMSAAAKAKLAAVARERWRKIKAQGKRAL